jgi:hypothetical protein
VFWFFNIAFVSLWLSRDSYQDLILATGSWTNVSRRLREEVKSSFDESFRCVRLVLWADDAEFGQYLARTLLLFPCTDDECDERQYWRRLRSESGCSMSITRPTRLLATRRIIELVITPGNPAGYGIRLVSDVGNPFLIWCLMAIVEGSLIFFQTDACALRSPVAAWSLWRSAFNESASVRRNPPRQKITIRMAPHR